MNLTTSPRDGPLMNFLSNTNTNKHVKLIYKYYGKTFYPI